MPPTRSIPSRAKPHPEHLLAQLVKERNRYVIGLIICIQIVYLQKRNDRGELELFEKTPELKNRLTALVMVGRICV